MFQLLPLVPLTATVRPCTAGVTHVTLCVTISTGMIMASLLQPVGILGNGASLLSVSVMENGGNGDRGQVVQKVVKEEHSHVAVPVIALHQTMVVRTVQEVAVCHRHAIHNAVL